MPAGGFLRRPSRHGLDPGSRRVRVGLSQAARNRRAMVRMDGRLPDIRSVNRKTLAETQTASAIARTRNKILSQISQSGGRSALMRASITSGVAGGRKLTIRDMVLAGLVIT